MLLACFYSVLIANSLIGTDELRDYLEVRQHVLCGLTVSFEMEEYFGRGAPQPSKPAELAPDSEHFVSLRCCSFTSRGACYRFADEYIDASAGLSELVGVRKLETFDGVECRQLAESPHGRPRAMISAMIGQIRSEKFLNWHGWSLMQLNKRMPLEALLSPDRLRAGPYLGHNGHTCWDFEIDIGSACLEARRGSTGIELVEISAHVWKDNGNKLASCHVVFGDYSQPFLSDTVSIVVSHFREDASDAFWGAEQIRLVSIDTTPPADDKPYRAEFLPNCIVNDLRYGFSYDLGGSSLYLWNRELAVDSSISDEIGIHIENWIPQDTLHPTHTEWAEPVSLDVASESEGLSRLGIAIACIGAGVVLLWHRRRVPAQHVSHVLLLMMPLWLLGCAGQASESVAGPTIEHVGTVWLDHGPQEISHEFTVTNDSISPLQVLRVKTTCGCVTADLEQAKLDPGQSTKLRLAYQVDHPGAVQQGATLVLSNGATKKYTLSATGSLGCMLSVFPTQIATDPKALALRAYLVTQESNERGDVLKVLSPSDATLSAGPWMPLEHGAGGRATRQVADCVLSLASADFPVQVSLGTESGCWCSISLQEDIASARYVFVDLDVTPSG